MKAIKIRYMRRLSFHRALELHDNAKRTVSSKALILINLNCLVSNNENDSLRGCTNVMSFLMLFCLDLAKSRDIICAKFGVSFLSQITFGTLVYILVI